MAPREPLYQGKAKKLYETGDPAILLVRYQDQATALDGLKREDFPGKGELNNTISSLFFQLLRNKGIESHFVRQTGPREMLVKKVNIIPVEVVIRNIAAGSMAKRLGLKEGMKLISPVLEYYLKDDDLHDPMINPHHIEVLNLARRQHLEAMDRLALEVNEVLREFLQERGIMLVDMKLEFGLLGDEVILADEISPDTCRFWDTITGEKLDKDRFRRDLGGLLEAYREVLRRLKEDRTGVEGKD